MVLATEWPTLLLEVRILQGAGFAAKTVVPTTGRFGSIVAHSGSTPTERKNSVSDP